MRHWAGVSERVEVEGAEGWSVRVTQTITYPDGTEEVNTWVVTYRPQPREVEVHPCLIPEEAENYTGEECPPEETTSSTDEGGGETPEDRKVQRDAWRTMQRSHAIGNGVFVAAVNRIGREDDLQFWGSSFVADPSGTVIAEARTGAGVDAVEKALRTALDTFRPEAKDHHRHIAKGRRDGIHWETATPVTDPGRPPRRR